MRLGAAVLLFFAYAQLSVGDSLESDFSEWKKSFNKKYATTELETKAFSNWKVNKALVDKANSGKNSWTAAVGKFADLSNEEFTSKMLLRPISSKYMSDIQPAKIAKKSDNLPSAFDWRSNEIQNIVTSVKDQGTVGSCWAFSTVGNIEGQWARAGHTLTDLSAEFLVDCDGTHDDEHADCSVFGGWPYLAYDFIIDSEGVPSEESYPYCSGTGDCYPCMLGPISLCGPPPYSCNKTITEQCPYATPTAVISDWSSVSTNEDDIASILYTTGPLSVLLDATQLQYYQGGIWNGHIDSVSPYLGCHTESLNHAVLLVGYGVDETSGTKYWTVKNSWGTNWGEEGYFRIVRGEGLCGINTAVTTSIV